MTVDAGASRPASFAGLPRSVANNSAGNCTIRRLFCTFGSELFAIPARYPGTWRIIRRRCSQVPCGSAVRSQMGVANNSPPRRTGPNAIRHCSPRERETASRSRAKVESELPMIRGGITAISTRSTCGHNYPHPRSDCKQLVHILFTRFQLAPIARGASSVPVVSSNAAHQRKFSYGPLAEWTRLVHSGRQATFAAESEQGLR